MQLELRQTEGPRSGGEARRWRLDHGRRTLGGGPDCDWQLEGVERTLSDYECWIASDQDGYVLTDRSAGGTRVGGTLVRQGETVRITDGALITFGPFQFAARVLGEPELQLGDADGTLGLSDEVPTITAILADVAPGRRASGGLSGAFQLDDPVPPARPLRSLRPGEALSTPSSRDVAIGWEGPPDIDASRQPLLPDDWNEETIGGDFTNELEHRGALSTSLPRLRGSADTTSRMSGARMPQTDRAEMPEAGLDALGRTTESDLTPAAGDGGAAAPGHGASASPVDPAEALQSIIDDIVTAPSRSDALADPVAEPAPALFDDAGSDSRELATAPLHQRLLPAVLRDCEDALGDIEALIGLRRPGNDPNAAVAFSDTDRLEAVLSRQIAVRDAFAQLMRDSVQHLDPRVIEARVDAAPRTILRSRAGRCWSAYREQFRAAGRDLSVPEFLQGLQQTHARKR